MGARRVEVQGPQRTTSLTDIDVASPLGDPDPACAIASTEPVFFCCPGRRRRPNVSCSEASSSAPSMVNLSSVGRSGHCLGGVP